MRRPTVVASLLVLALALLLMGAGCGDDTQARKYIREVRLLNISVTPPSGTARFELAVDYMWSKSADARPATISCYYVRPDGTRVIIEEEIDPSGGLGEVLVENDQTVTERTTLSFDVTRPDGTIQPGEYTAACETLLGHVISTPFTVTGPEATSTTSASTTTTELTTTTIPLRVYKLHVDMKGPVSADLHASWGGELNVRPDGSVREKLPGEFDDVVSLTSRDNKPLGDYKIDVTFNVDVAGAVELTPSGPVLRLQQTAADYTVHPVTVVSGSIQPTDLAQCQKAVEEAAPKWLDTILRELVFEGKSLPATQDVSVGIWTGTATISQVR